MTYSLISLVALSSLSALAPSNADWTRSTYLVPVTDTQSIEVEHVIAQNMSEDGTPLAGSVGFACAGQKLHVMFSYDDVELDSAFKEAWTERRAKQRVGTLSVDGESQRRGGFTEMRDTKLYMSMSPADKRSFYKSVVQAQNVAVRLRGETIQLSMPAINDDFREFGAACGLGTLADDS